MEQDYLQELRKELVQALGQNMADWEETILILDRTLEGVGGRAEAIGQAFRIAHSIKGSCAALGLKQVAEFGHVVEDCLSTPRNRNDRLQSDAISVLLKCGDEFKRAVQYISDCREKEWSAGALLGEVRAWSERLGAAAAGGKPAVAAQLAASHFELEALGEAPAIGPLVSATARALEHPTAHPESPATGKSAESIRMNPARLEALLDLVGELVVIKSQILMEFGERSTQDLKSGALLTLFDRTVRDLQDRALGMRMTSLKPLFMRIRRVVRDTSAKVQKPADLEVAGEEMEIDRSMIELRADPLMHLVRNALDHGIEGTIERAETGKPLQARLEMKAERRGGRLELIVRDDGRGIHRERVLNRARERGLIPAGVNEERLTDSEVFEFLFMPGFSAAEKVTDISGRGVGWTWSGAMSKNSRVRSISRARGARERLSGSRSPSQPQSPMVSSCTLAESEW